MLRDINYDVAQFSLIHDATFTLICNVWQSRYFSQHGLDSEETCKGLPTWVHIAPVMGARGELSAMRKIKFNVPWETVGMRADDGDCSGWKISLILWCVLPHMHLQIVLLVIESGTQIFSNVLTRQNMLSDLER